MTSIGDPLVGRVLDGRYQITARLARGGMATVYQAVDTRLTRTVAIKVMHVGLGDDAEFARKFDREARAAARLSHPNVVSVFDQGHDHGRPYIVMEYVDGRTLRDVISREAPLTPLRALEMIEPVLSALACAHDAGLVHRDVKPENVLISDRGQIKVADFGLAKAISAQTSTATQGLLIGTVSYLPPELVISGRADPRSDVYSAGVVLFEMLTGTKPHTGETPIQVAYAHVHKDVPPPSSCATAGPVPPYLDALLGRVTARDPDVRPHDAKVMLTLVRRVRAALREGATDDEELTQDLTIPQRTLRSEPLGFDRSDVEETQLVVPETGHPAAARSWTPAAVPKEQERPRTPSRDDSWPQARDGSRPDARDDSWPNARDDSWPNARDAPPPATGRQPVPEPRPDRADAERRRVTRARKRGWIALLLVLLLTAAAAVTGWYYTDGRFTTAPELSSMTQGQAEEAARGAGLAVGFRPAFSESVAKGLVISVDPDSGAKVLPGTELAAVVSSGPERHVVPALTGLTRAAAQQALGDAALSLGRVRSAYSATVADGTVLGTTPAAKSPLKRSAAVDLTVSAGPEPVSVVSYQGRSARTAAAALKKAGFTVTTTTTHSATVAKGRVVTQQPAGGTGHAGDTVTLEKSLGPVMVTVPAVKKSGVEAATRRLEKAGFRVRTKPVKENYLGLGYVSYTDPAAGSRAPLGSVITLYMV